MASSVTAPLERQFGQVPGLNQMTSTSADGASVITLQFALDLDIDIAEQQVQASINAAGTFLPRDLPNPPVYSKVNPADSPILTLGLTSDSLPLSRVHDLADTRLAQKISQLPGVGLVSLTGGQKPAVRVRANPTAPLLLRADARGRPQRHRRLQREPGQGQLRRPQPRLHDRRQRPAADERGLQAPRRGLPQRRAGPPPGRGRRGGRHGERAPGRLDERGARGHREHPAPAGREHHPGRRPREGAPAAAADHRCRRRSRSRSSRTGRPRSAPRSATCSSS